MQKQSTIDQDFQNSNNQLKFSIASLLFNDNLSSKKQIAFDYQRASSKFEHHHHPENANCLDLSCFTCKSSIKNWVNWCNLNKQHIAKDLSAFNVNSVKSKPCDPLMNHQLNQQISQQLNQQINQHFSQQIGHQQIASPNRSPISSLLPSQPINASSLNSSLHSSLQSSLQTSLQSSLQSSLTSSLQSSLHSSIQPPASIPPAAGQMPVPLPHAPANAALQPNKSAKVSFSHQTPAQQLSSYLNSLNGQSAGGKMTHHSISNKKKRVRTIYTPEQLERLEKEFERTQYMVGHDRLSLAAELNLSEVQVKVWYQNKRIKFRKGMQLDLEKKRETIPI